MMQWAWHFLALGTLMSCPTNVVMQAEKPGYVAHVVSVVTFPLDDATFSALTPEQRAKLEQEGIRILDQERALQSPERDLSRAWLEFGKKRYITDGKGYIHLPKIPATTTHIKVFAELHDELPVGVLETISFVPEGQTPPDSVLKVTHKIPVSMNPEEETAGNSSLGPGKVALFGSCTPNAACLVSHRTVRESIARGEANPPPLTCLKNRPQCKTGNKSPCCLDYDGPPPRGDGNPYYRDPLTAGPLCALQGYLNFFGSTCYKWTVKLVCINEAAFHEGPSCWRHHKYRNCQNLDETDLHLDPSSKSMVYGNVFNFNVHNNTPGNSTYLTFIENPGGGGRLQRVDRTRLKTSAAVGGYELEHFIDADTMHYGNGTGPQNQYLRVRFKPRKPPKDVCEDKYVIQAFTDDFVGATDQMEITVTNPECKTAWKCKCSGAIFDTAQACAKACPPATLACIAPTCLEIDRKTGKWTGKAY